MEVTINKKEWTGIAWMVYAIIKDAAGTRSGPHTIDLPEDASDSAIKAAIAALYGG